MEFYNKNYDIYSIEKLNSFINNKKIIIFGATTRINNLPSEYLRKTEYICDNDSNKWGKRFCGINVYSPNELKKENQNEIIIITLINDYQTIIKQFINLGIINYFFYTSFGENYLNTFVKKKIFNESNEIIEKKNKRFDYVHIFLDEKFIKAFIKILEDNFEISKHLFIIDNVNLSNVDDKYNNWSFYEIKNKEYNNIYILDDVYNLNLVDNYERMVKIRSILFNCKKIVFHSGIISHSVAEFFSKNKKLLEDKVIWCVWGYDAYLDPNNKIVKEVLRFINKVNSDDIEYENIVKNYNMKKCKNLRNNVSYTYFSKDDFIKYEKKYTNLKENCKSKKILIGHSASSEGNHIEALEMLSRYKDKNIEIYCPLSYGDESYAIKVKEYGYKIFKEKFNPIFEYMSEEKYIDFIAKIDIAVMPFKRLMGVNNIFLLLYFGKKVYLERELWMLFLERNLKLNDIKNIENENFNQFVKNINKNINHEEFKKSFNPHNTSGKWRKLFEE